MGFLAQPSQASAASANAADAAVKALLKWKDNESAFQKGQLLPGDDFLYLYLTLQKIPQKSRTNPFKIPLPHPLLDPSSELCLIVDDRNQAKLSKEDAKKIVKSQNLPISKVLRLSKLKANYKPHEAKRKLCDSFDAFLVDRSIVHLLPKLLGKFFFNKKKLPVPLDLSHKNFKEQIERISRCGLLYMRTGSCCVMKVAKMSMESEEIVENVVQAIDEVVKVVPKGWRNVRSLHLKVSGSLALPIFQALPDVKLRIEGLKETETVRVDQIEIGEDNQEIENNNSKKKKKGRIHEVKYMDFGIKVDASARIDVNEVDDALELVEQSRVTEDENGDKSNTNKEQNKMTKVKKKHGKKDSNKHRLSAPDAEQFGKSKLLNEESRTKKTKRSKNVA